MWPPRRWHIKSDDGDYDQDKDTEPEPPRRRKKVTRSANLFIDAKAGVDGDTIGDEKSSDKNDDLDGFIVADDIEFLS